MKIHSLYPPLTDEDILKLRAGDKVAISGQIYTARDAAHKRLIEALEKEQELPFPLEGSVIYYVGPSPAPPGRPIGSAGPTSSYRMDSYAGKLYSLGIKATIGKGKRNKDVKQAMQNYCGVYLGATGGAGALLSQHIVQARVIAYEDLGPEAIRVLEVKNFPALVVNDAYGRELYVNPKGY